MVYALPHRQRLVQLEVAAGCTAGEAIEASGLLHEHPEIDLANNPVGIYGKLATLDSVLREHDRVEVYRALVADPKEMRRRRAAEQRKAGAGRRKTRGSGVR